LKTTKTSSTKKYKNRVYTTHSKNNLYWQYFFYVALILFSLILPTVIQAYSSKFLTKSIKQKTIKTYYSKHLKNLRKPVKPRIIHYIDSENYKRYGKLNITGILFTYKSTHSQKVNFICNLDRYKKHSMLRNKKGIWYFILTLNQYLENQHSKKIQYKFQANSLYDIDHTHNNINANGLSVFYLTDEDQIPKTGPIILKNSTLYTKEVIFRIYSPKSEQISLIGSFNNWNSSIDILKKNKRGYFEIKKPLAPGEYIYYYRIDGIKEIDPKNFNFKKHSVFGKVSYLKVNK